MPDQIPSKQEVVDGVPATQPAMNVYADFQVQTSLPMETSDNRSLILEIIEGPCDSADDVIGIPFLLSDYICHAIQLEIPETGELVNAVRTLMIRPDSIPIGCVSVGVLKSLGRLGWAHGRCPPWEPPLRVKLTQVSTRVGRRTYKLVPVKD